MSSSNFCGNSDITKIFIVESTDNNFTGGTIDGNLVVNGDIINCSIGATIYTENIIACDTGVTINNAITIHPTDIVPTTDNLINFCSF